MTTTLIRRARTLPLAVEAADGVAAVTFPDASQLIRRRARWRGEPPTDKQKAMLARYAIRMPEGLTRGQAAQMISMVLASGRGRAVR